MATIIDGTALARQIRQQVTARTAELSAQGKVVHLTAILVGSTPAGELYAQRQKETCAAVGINYELITLPADATFAVGDDVIHARFGDGVVTGLEAGGLVVVRFASDGSQRRLMADYAPLKKK